MTSQLTDQESCDRRSQKTGVTRGSWWQYQRLKPSLQSLTAVQLRLGLWHSCTLALSPEHQSAQMSEIKNVG